MRLLSTEKSRNYSNISNEVIFPSFIWSCSINIDPNEVKREIYNIKNNYLSVVASNSSIVDDNGGYHSPYFSTNGEEDYDSKFLRGVIGKSELFINECLSTFLHVDKKVEVIDYWALINKPYDYNMIHIHPHTDLIGIYYVCLPNNSGNLFIIRDDSFHTTNLGIECKRRIFAQEGNLYILPANLFHYVEPNMSHDDRISVALNIKVTNTENAETRPVFKPS